MKKEGHEFITMSDEERAKCFEQLMPVLRPAGLKNWAVSPRWPTQKLCIRRLRLW